MSPYMMALLQRTNPVPDAGTLADSDEARELAMRKPGSIIDWRIRADDDYAGDGYRIRLLEAYRWEVTHRGRLLAHERSLKGAFATAERHRRAAVRRRDLSMWAGLVALAVVAGVVLREVALGGAWVLVGIAIVWLGVAGVVRFLATLGPNADDPYRRRLPWERRRRS